MINNLKRFLLIITVSLLLIVLVNCNNIYGYELKDDDLYCKSDVLMDLDSGIVLYGKNSKEKIYPASTTKILTAILTIENLDLDKRVIVSQNAYNSTPYGSSVMGVKPNEEFTIRDLLYGLLLPSGNDAAIVLAEAVAGDIDKFVFIMNRKLEELELKNTHFVNPHGFHEDNHYSTAEDMANLLRYCLQNKTFKEIISTLEYEIKPTNITNKSRVLRNTARICDPLYTRMYYEYILGGKTGYTEEANGTFVGYGSKDDKNVIVCSFNGSQNINGLQGRFLDAKTMAKYCFENYEKITITKDSFPNFKIYNSNENKYYLVGLSEDYSLLKKIDDDIHIIPEITANFNELELLSSVEETSKDSSNVGRLGIYNQNNELLSYADIVFLDSGEYISKTYSKSSNGFMIIIIVFSILVFILLIGLLLKKSKKKKKKNNKKKGHMKNNNID